MTCAISLKNISKSFFAGAQQTRAADHISLDIRENEFFTLLGPSGCGKTTLLRLITGLEQPDTGKVFLFDNDITGLPANKRPINTVFQNYALFPHLTVAENIAFGLKMQKKPKAEIDATVQEMLRLVRLEGMLNRKPSELSGGQQQRVALARALANHPKVLLLDEPLSALDSKLRKEMQQEFKRLQQETHITFIFVTHDQDEALSMSGRVAVMNKGKIVQVGTPQDIYRKPANRFVADFIGYCNFVPPSLLGKSGTEDIGFRPEDARLVAVSEDNLLKGTLQAVSYKGSITDYHVTLQNGPDIIVTSHQALSFKVGNAVGVQIDGERLITCSA